MIDQDVFSKNTVSFGSKGLVFVGSNIVVCRRDDKTNVYPLCIDLPGGAPEVGESPFDTFKREVKEEIGLDIHEFDVVYSKQYGSLSDQTKPVYFIVVKSEKIKAEDIVFGDEGLEYLIMTPENFVNLTDSIPKHQQKVSEYLNTLKK